MCCAEESSIRKVLKKVISHCLHLSSVIPVIMCFMLRMGRAGAAEFEEQKFFKWKLSPNALIKKNKNKGAEMDVLFPYKTNCFWIVK